MPPRRFGSTRALVVPPLSVDARPWGPDEARRLRTLAQQRFTPDDLHRAHNRPDGDEVERDNCAACALAGWRELPNDDTAPGEVVLPQPNYGGWARLFVQAGRPVPRRWRAALIADLDPQVSNPSYAAALGRDLATWGVVYCE